MTPERAKELLPIITAFAEGKAIQWSEDGCAWEDTGFPQFHVSLKWRIKPEPKTRPWSSPDDVPGPVCWLKFTDFDVRMIVGIARHMILVSSAVLNGGISRISWYEFAQQSSWMHSTDRKTWHPCTITEE